MYPDASTRNIGGGGNADWQARVPDALKNKIPEGADYIQQSETDKNVYIFFKNGKPMENGKFNADGSVYDPTKSENANPDKTTKGNVGNANGAGKTGGVDYSGVPNDVLKNYKNGSGSAFGFGFNQNTSGDIGANFINGNYSIDAKKFMGAAAGFSAVSSIAQMIPFGLGGLFSQGAVGTMLNGFAKSISFNFDFSSMFASGTNDDKKEDTPATDDLGTPTVVKKEDTPATTPADDQGTPAVKKEDTPANVKETPAEEKKDTPAAATEDKNAPPAGYKFSKHTHNVMYKSENGATKYYIKQNGKMVEISDYNGSSYKLNGKYYNAKTGKTINAPTANSSAAKKEKEEIKPTKSFDEQMADKGYVKSGNFYKKNNNFYAKRTVNGQSGLYKVTQMFHGDYYRIGDTTYDKNGKAISTFKKGDYAGSYTTSRSAESTMGHSYGKNDISKEKTTRDSVDSDAQFHINGKAYNLKLDNGGMMDTTLDYCDITGQRTSGTQGKGHAFIKYDGSFNPNAGIFNGKNKVYFSGDGEFKNCQLLPITDMNRCTCLCIKSGSIYYDFDTLMRTGQKVQVIPGTFISQGR